MELGQRKVVGGEEQRSDLNFIGKASAALEFILADAHQAGSKDVALLATVSNLLKSIALNRPSTN